MFQLDTNRINSRGKLPNINQLEKWHADGVILMDLSLAAKNECDAGNSPRRAEKASEYIFSIPIIDSSHEREIIVRIERLLFPKGAADQNQRNDIAVIFTAAKYNAILVTNDGDSKSQPGGILGYRNELAEMNIRVMRDDDAVKLVLERILHRDEMAALEAKNGIHPLPFWHGKD